DASGQILGSVTAALTGLVPLAKPLTIDSRNRTLYVTATEEQHREIAEVLQKLDAPGKQIMIQARVVQVNANATQDLQQVISAVYDRWLMNFSNGGARIGFEQSNRTFPSLNMTIPYSYLAGETSTLPVDINGAEKTLMAGLNALEQTDRAKVLAHPSVIAIDGQQATVTINTEMPYRSGTDANGNPEIETMEYGPTLTFTPTIGRDGWITIDIDVDASELASLTQGTAGSYIPAKSTRHVKTIVRVYDGEPFAVGGLYQERKAAVRSRMPVLGYIPLLGDLFTTRNETHTKTEVAIIAIPYILDITDESIKTFDLQKPQLSTR
ncbi:MAG: hypothetical protein LBL73_07170, partial [Synergistaceae bacterium]|nr:hypothetical protein [Synergistaceae bacterium]